MLVTPVAAVTASGDVPGALAVISVIVLSLTCTAMTYLLYY